MFAALLTIPISLLVCTMVRGAPMHGKTTSTADPMPTANQESGLASRPAPEVAFAADSNINVAAIYAAVKSATNVPLQAGSYPSTTDDGEKQVQIYGDWLTLGSAAKSTSKSSAEGTLDSRRKHKLELESSSLSAFHFIADMDIDCDGPTYHCKGNTDGQKLTSFGALDAREIPFFVLPDYFTDAHEDILKPNALGAVICDGRMFYGICGDQGGDDPRVIGEASLRMVQTCFPNATIDGTNGHPEVDVAYIVFGTQVPNVENNSLNMTELKSMRDTQVRLLQDALGISALVPSTAD